MEIYLTAVIKFFLKPRVRLWNPDGSLSMVTITAPQSSAGPTLKGYSGDEAQQRLTYLSQIVDTRGWASRGVTSAPPSLNDTVVAEAQNTEDIMDDHANVAQNFDDLITREDTRRRQAVVNQFQQQAAQQPSQQALQANDDVSEQDAFAQLNPAKAIAYNPYPNMHQRVVGGTHDEPKKPSQMTPVKAPEENKDATHSQPVVSPDTIRLANNNDLTISAIAREAHRLEAKDNEEVVIALR